jgi:hypothetical protein
MNGRFSWLLVPAVLVAALIFAAPQSAEAGCPVVVRAHYPVYHAAYYRTAYYPSYAYARPVYYAPVPVVAYRPVAVVRPVVVPRVVVRAPVVPFYGYYGW